jgi:hypothetical protein
MTYTATPARAALPYAEFTAPWALRLQTPRPAFRSSLNILGHPVGEVRFERTISAPQTRRDRPLPHTPLKPPGVLPVRRSLAGERDSDPHFPARQPCEI